MGCHVFSSTACEYNLPKFHQSVILFIHCCLTSVVWWPYFSTIFTASLLIRSDLADVNEIGQPPTALIHCIISWLQAARSLARPHHSASSHSLAPNWTSIDWSALIRRYKFYTQPHCTAELVCTYCPPVPIGFVWWTVFSPVRLETWVLVFVFLSWFLLAMLILPTRFTFRIGQEKGILSSIETSFW